MTTPSDFFATLANFQAATVPFKQLSLARKARLQLGKIAPPNGWRQLRVAVLASGTLSQFADLLCAMLAKQQIAIDVYESDYGSVPQAILNPASDLYTFAPDVVILLTNQRDLLTIGQLSAGADIDALQRAELQHWQSLWQTLGERTNATIIQNNFDLPAGSVFGSMDQKLRFTPKRYIQELNLLFADAMPAHVLVHDLAGLAATVGAQSWQDPRMYHHAKQPCTLENLPRYAQSVAQLILASVGHVKKCLVLDLDNTLWGGVIGDDGLSGIELGQGSPLGEAHLALQRYALRLKDRGVLLAVCSKNNIENAVQPFQSHPDMLLKEDDIACFVANWLPKPDNIRTISETLNIGLDSFVFVDDNPAERAIVREFLPMVAVPEMPEDAAYYVRTLQDGQYFESITYSAEDANRTAMYKANQARQEQQQSSVDMDSFLGSLNMEAIIRPFQAADMERIAQLIARSNQFNLLTRRHSLEALQHFAQDPNVLTISMRLKDKFGDNGLIAVWIGMGDTETKTVTIDTWLMSCRVLSRGAEQHLRNHVAMLCQDAGYDTLVGVYSPTKKNRMVADLYPRLGFEATDTDNVWALALNNYAEIPTHITTLS